MEDRPYHPICQGHGPVKLEESIVYVLASSGHGVKTEQIAREINERKLCIRKGNIPVDGKIMYAVIMSHPDSIACWEYTVHNLSRSWIAKAL
jgi:hypothetical protein